MMNYQKALKVLGDGSRQILPEKFDFGAVILFKKF
jgi:hypothetical protein